MVLYNIVNAIADAGRDLSRYQLQTGISGDLTGIGLAVAFVGAGIGFIYYFGRKETTKQMKQLAKIAEYRTIETLEETSDPNELGKAIRTHKQIVSEASANAASSLNKAMRIAHRTPLTFDVPEEDSYKVGFAFAYAGDFIDSMIDYVQHLEQAKKLEEEKIGESMKSLFA